MPRELAFDRFRKATVLSAPYTHLATTTVILFPVQRSTLLIPKGLRPPAQGCLPSEVLLTKEGEATLGNPTASGSTSKRVRLLTSAPTRKMVL